MSIIDKVRAKINEYGLEIYSDYPLIDGDNEDYVFFVEEMILFINEKEKSSIAVSFQASTRPERAANMILILNEIETNIDVMESFIFDKNNEYLSGEKAFDLIEKSKQSDVIQDFVKDQTYKEILLTAKCHEC
jgi:hypothetical protein